MRFRHYLLILTQVATNGFWTFNRAFQVFYSPRRGAMSIEMVYLRDRTP